MKKVIVTVVAVVIANVAFAGNEVGLQAQVRKIDNVIETQAVVSVVGKQALVRKVDAQNEKQDVVVAVKK